MLQLKAVQLQVTNISSGWLHGDHCRLDALWNEPCKICEGIDLTISPMVSIYISGFFAKQRHSHGKKVNTTSTVSYWTCSNIWWQGPYRYSVRLEGCSGGVGAHSTAPAGDDQHSWQSVATLTASYQCPNNTATASCRRNEKTKPTQRLGCKRVALTLSFPYAIPLWSSIE